jgi:hypothetical protein
MARERIWIGYGEVRALKGASGKLRKATYMAAVVFAYAKSRKDFEQTMKATLADARLELTDLDDAGPAHKMLDVDKQSIGCIVATAETGTPTFELHITDESPDAVDQDAETIRAAMENGEAVQFRLIGGDYYYFGFVVDVSDAWALFNDVDRNVVAFDGYLAVPFDRIIDAEVIDTAQIAVAQALRLRGEGPRNPHVPLDGHRAVLMELSKRYPLVSLADRRNPGVFYVGRITTIEDDKVTLRGVDRAGQWTGDHEHFYKDVEMISFGSAYEAALASVLE